MVQKEEKIVKAIKGDVLCSITQKYSLEISNQVLNKNHLKKNVGFAVKKHLQGILHTKFQCIANGKPRRHPRHTRFIRPKKW
jgi:hypothetical protein